MWITKFCNFNMQIVLRTMSSINKDDIDSIDKKTGHVIERRLTDSSEEDSVQVGYYS